jgi:tRNA G18 (ribose-2'-O)-methylase SpoU
MPKSQEKKDIYLIAYNIRSLFNVGAMFRIADALGIKKIYLCGYTGYPPRSQISKTALGAENTVPWEHHWQGVKLIKKLKKQGVKIIVLETIPGAKPLPNFKAKFPAALIVGNEKTGLSPQILKLANAVVQIPMQGIKESLNVAVAAGIGLYHLTYQNR